MLVAHKIALSLKTMSKVHTGQRQRVWHDSPIAGHWMNGIDNRRHRICQKAIRNVSRA
jgi:hypothetical protein